MIYVIWYMLYGTWYMVYGTWYLVPPRVMVRDTSRGLLTTPQGDGICYMVHVIWYMVYGTWYLVPPQGDGQGDVQRLVDHAPG